MHIVGWLQGARPALVALGDEASSFESTVGLTCIRGCAGPYHQLPNLIFTVVL